MQETGSYPVYNYDNLEIKVGYTIEIIGGYTVYSPKHRPQKKHHSVKSFCRKYSIHREGIITGIERIDEEGNKSTRVHIRTNYGKDIYRHPKFVRLYFD